MSKSKIEKRFLFIKRLVNRLLGHIGWQYPEMLNEIVWKCQRFHRGYADIDVWAIDCWLSDIMPRILDQFIEELHGYPSALERKKIPGALPVNALSDDYDPQFEKWKEILREIKDGFVAWKEMEDANIWRDEEAKPYIKRFRKSMLLMTKWFGNLWD